jgi:hypothetical protein
MRQRHLNFASILGLDNVIPSLLKKGRSVVFRLDCYFLCYFAKSAQHFTNLADNKNTPKQTKMEMNDIC